MHTIFVLSSILKLAAINYFESLINRLFKYMQCINGWIFVVLALITSVAGKMN